MNKLKLPMRDGVAVIILNKKNEVFVGKRKDNPIDKWQMPQGGIDDGEDYISAMKRELFEETSINSIEILKEIDGFFEYQLPNNLVGIIWKGKFRGQTQKWYIMRFLGEDNEINLKTKHPEFLEWKWINHENITDKVVEFKLHVYAKIKNELNKPI